MDSARGAADASQWTQVRRYNGDMVIRYWREGGWSAWSKNVDLSRRDYTSPARLVAGAETDRDPTTRDTPSPTTAATPQETGP